MYVERERVGIVHVETEWVGSSPDLKMMVELGISDGKLLGFLSLRASNELCMICKSSGQLT